MQFYPSTSVAPVRPNARLGVHAATVGRPTPQYRLARSWPPPPGRRSGVKHEKPQYGDGAPSELRGGPAPSITG